MPNTEDCELLDAARIASFCGCSRSKAYELMRLIGPLRLGRSSMAGLRVRRADFERWLDRQGQGDE